VRRIPLARPSLGAAEEAEVLAAMRSGWLTRGPRVEAFEAAVGGYLGIEHAVAVSSGTAAIHLALVALGVGQGDEVIVPDFTFPASANAVRHCGAEPVLLDIDPETLNLSVDALRDFLERDVPVDGVARNRVTGRRIGALMPVHLFGLPADMDEISAMAAERGIPVLEDAAGALGATHRGRFCGTLGVAGCLSFHPRKVVTTGEGGMVITSDPAVADGVRRWRNHGMALVDGRVVFADAGYNLRLGELNAAIGLAQMERIGSLLKRLGDVAACYDDALAGLPGVTAPPRRSGRVYQAYVVRLDARIDRDRVQRELARRDIETTLGTYAVSGQPAHGGRPLGRVAAEAQATTLALPFYADLAEEDVRRVTLALRESLA
jgi:dTDP-4-amino-4,6-dideoxygalactose transaminase